MAVYSSIRTDKFKFTSNIHYVHKKDKKHYNEIMSCNI